MAVCRETVAEAFSERGALSVGMAPNRHLLNVKWKGQQHHARLPGVSSGHKDQRRLTAGDCCETTGRVGGTLTREEIGLRFYIRRQECK